MAFRRLSNPILEEDVTQTLNATISLWEELRAARIFMTGGTGFFGRWLLLVLERADALHGLGLHITVLSRHPEAFAHAHPELVAGGSVSFLAGDVRNFPAPPQPADFIIHAAAEASAALNRQAPLEMFDTIIGGTRRVLEYAQASGTRRMLFVSSGAIYGPQPTDLSHMAETFPGKPDPLLPGNAYGVAKCAAEFLCATMAAEKDLAIPIARPFAFLGPFLPLDRHFAAGNFLADALAGGPVRVQGDGTPFRSYMYPTDLVEWLLTVLLHGASGRAYNVGSAEAVSIATLATMVAEAAGGIPVSIARTPDPSQRPSRYVPNIDRACQELGLSMRVGLRQAIARTLASCCSCTPNQ